jgi:hypothetical protein
MSIWQVLIKQDAKARNLMNRIELLGRRVKILRMLKLLVAHIEYLPENEQQYLRDLAIVELKGKQKVMKAGRGE